MSGRLGLILVLGGLALLALTGTAQFSSLLTPYLAAYPPLLTALGSGGVLLLCLAALACIGCAAYRHSTLWIVAAGTYLALAGLVRGFPLLTAFQLLVAGLTVGGGLLVLGGTHLRMHLKDHL